MRLEVRVNGRKVASLFREAEDYVLLYDRDAAESDFVSLTMPVRARPWIWPRALHPFFRQNLPEGYLLGILRESFGRYLDGTDLSLLALVGGSGIGRVTVVPEGKPDAGPVTAFDLQRVLHGDNSAAAFEALVREHALNAVSGVYPKFLAPPDHTPIVSGRVTLRTGRYLVKGSGERTPFLAMNEHYSLAVLRRTGALPVVDSRLSDDGRVLAVTRFDVDGHGHPHRGLEDACNLLGRPPEEKYAPTTEEALRALRTYLAPGTAVRDLERLGWLILSSYVIRNADQHSKNLALCYTCADDVELAPAYAVVTTQAYPEFARNIPGLSIEGRKSWVAGKSLQRLFNVRLGISPSRFREMTECLCEAATETGRELLPMAREYPERADVIRNMLHAWNDGMESIRSAKPAPAQRALQPDLDAAGLGHRDRPAGNTVVGKSPLIGKKRPF